MAAAYINGFIRPCSVAHHPPNRAGFTSTSHVASQLRPARSKRAQSSCCAARLGSVLQEVRHVRTVEGERARASCQKEGGTQPRGSEWGDAVGTAAAATAAGSATSDGDAAVAAGDGPADSRATTLTEMASNAGVAPTMVCEWLAAESAMAVTATLLSVAVLVAVLAAATAVAAM